MTTRFREARPHRATSDLRRTNVVDLRALIVQDLDELTMMAPLADHLVDTRQAGIGFLTVEGALMMDEQLLKERRDRLANLKDGIVITGAVPAPVNIAAVSIVGEIQLELLDIARRIRRGLHDAGVCPITKPPTSITTPLVVADVRRLVTGVASVPVLVDIARTVQDLVERLRHIVLGNDRTTHPKPCPHCGRHTLVVYLTAGIIRCERDPDTGDYEACICPDSYCDCKTRGTHHEWRRDIKASKQGSWQSLARDQARAERAHGSTDQHTTSKEPSA